MSRTPEPSNTPSNTRTGDGRFAKGNPGGPGRPRSVVRGAAPVLDQVSVEASAELLEVAIELARAGKLKAMKRVLARVWPRRRAIAPRNATRNHEKRIRALEEWFSRTRPSS